MKLAEVPVAILSEHTGGDSSPTDGRRGFLRFQAKEPRLSSGKLTSALREHAMQVQVETYVDEGGAEKLRRFRLDSRVVEVAENIDQWYGADYRYVKVKGSDGNVYVLRHNEIRAEWELTMYQHSQSQGAS
jgi:hypothetical protein